ncbi:MAG: DUF4423 domain-containing protein [Bdellovibrionales bacterium]|nr:DUF4423 domain-containing protein [Bdellovibrionales bacterium]
MELKKEKPDTPSPKKGQIQPIDLKGHLQQELLRRIKLNPQYSLRSFAQYLEVNSGSLSQILKGQRTIGKKLKQKLIAKLQLTPEQVNSLENKSAAFNQLEIDHFNVISDWYHFAIIELIKTENFNPSEKWIAKKLNITVAEVHIALERLLRLQLIQQTNSSYEVCENNLSNLSHLSRDYTNVAFKKYQKQILTKALSALENTPLPQRLQTSLAVAINLEDLEKVKEILHRCRREINAFVESNPKKQTVYHLSLSLYPVIQDIADQGENL